MVDSVVNPKITRWRKKYPVIFFVSSFAVMMIVFYMIYFSLAAKDQFFLPLISIYSELSGGVLNLLGYGVMVNGTVISSPQFSVNVKMGCDAIEAMAIFFIGVFAFPARPVKKLTGFLAGIIILFFLNAIRIVSLFIAGLHSQSLFETMHTVVWQILFILFPVVLWFLWIRFAVKSNPKK